MIRGHAAYRADKAAEVTAARREFRHHRARPADAHSYHVGRPGDGNNSFVMTWTPGHLTIVGDVGDIGLTHYSALADLESGLRWVAKSDYAYLMEKSDRREKELDAEATVEQWVDWARDEARYAREEECGERRAARRRMREGHWEWADDMAHWNYFARDEPPPVLVDYMPVPVEAPSTWREETRHGLPRTVASPGWQLWLGLYEEVEFDVEGGPGSIFTPAGRRAIEAALYESIEEKSRDEVVDTCRDLGLDDYYGTYYYPLRTVWLIEALRAGANCILDELDPSRTWGRTWSDPVV